jgi:hypothetical protein
MQLDFVARRITGATRTLTEKHLGDKYTHKFIKEKDDKQNM